MFEAILAAFGLGIAGIDPLGAVILMTAIASNFTRFKIVVFTFTILLSTVLAGTVLSITGAGFLTSIKDFLPVNTSSVWLYVNLIIAAITLTWVITRIKNKNKTDTEKPRKKMGNSYYVVTGTGILFGASSVLDPTYLAAISLAAQTNNIATIVTMHTIWTLTSQFMLFALFIAFLNGNHEKLVTYSQSYYAKHKNLLRNLLYVAAIGVVIFLIADSLNFIFSGKYILNL